MAGLLELTDAESVEKWQAGQDPNYPVHSTSKQAVILYSKRLRRPCLDQVRGADQHREPGTRRDTDLCPISSRPMGKDVLDMCRATVGRHASVDDIVPVIAFSGPRGSAGSRARTFRSTAVSSVR